MREYHLQTKYGISRSDYDDVLRRQNGACILCRSTGVPLVVDHSHETGVVRGLLCGSCNRALGLFKDDPSALSRAVEYVLGIWPDSELPAHHVGPG